MQNLIKASAADAGVTLRRFIRWEILTEPLRIRLYLTPEIEFEAPLPSGKLNESITAVRENLTAYMFIIKDQIDTGYGRYI